MGAVKEVSHLESSTIQVKRLPLKRSENHHRASPFLSFNCLGKLITVNWIVQRYWIWVFAVLVLPTLSL
ncbi:hypothetical protein OIU79_015570 [Salix purpurea]|uniref:Uncharacterized protein n=1 Tax=Salix purpurea TaxID=77065 RepID=A0A9Q0PC48_SALPP|nr:hypothetical protein OIU79_015570 [Salix purpurea]